MAKSLKELQTEIAAKSNQVNDLFDAADKRGDGANTKEEIAQIKALNKEIGDLEEQKAEIMEVEAIKSGNSDRLKSLNEPVRNVPFPGGEHNFSNTGDHGQPGFEFKSVGRQVLEDKEMAAFLKQFEGRMPPSRSSIQSPRVEVKTLLTGASATSAGAFTFADRKPITDQFFQRPLTIRDIITSGETTSDMVEYVRITGVTNNAAPVAEATATGDGTGAKPESAMAMAIVQETVKTIAHWIPATNRSLSDAGQLRTLIDSFLRYGLDEELEDQILTGDGNGENFTGVLNTANTSSQAFDTNILTTTRKARTKVRTLGRARPTAWVMHPNDWEDFDLLQDNEARYYYGGPSNPGQPRLWGLPVVESEGMTEGTTVVADWRLAVLWDRMQTAISMSNSHSDFFVRNLVAILAEMRAAFGVIRPAAFVETDLTA
jgi:HK97 family phage major capsid protein